MCIVHSLDPGDPASFACAQAGCRECLNTLLAWHERLVRYVVRNQIWGGVPEDDLLQEGRIALWRAIEGYDPQRGAAFSTYASVAIARRVWRATQQERDQRRLVRQADPPDAYLMLEAGIWQALVGEVLAEGLGHLSERQRRVLELVYGVGEDAPLREDGRDGWMLKEVGEQWGVSKERVRQVRNDALAVLRLPVYSVHLRQLCEQDSRDAYLHSRQLSRQWLRKGGAK
jgi:RNA polymerase sigma factor (sigma-70 family)